MIKYLDRTCPMCGGFLGIVVGGTADGKVHPIHGICKACGYQISWVLIDS